MSTRDFLYVTRWWLVAAFEAGVLVGIVVTIVTWR